MIEMKAPLWFVWKFSGSENLKRWGLGRVLLSSSSHPHNWHHHHHYHHHHDNCHLLHPQHHCESGWIGGAQDGSGIIKVLSKGELQRKLRGVLGAVYIKNSSAFQNIRFTFYMHTGISITYPRQKVCWWISQVTLLHFYRVCVSER